MDRRPLALAVLALILGPLAVSAQEYELPTPEEYAEKAERAENAPLFQSEDPLLMTLRTDIKWLRDERNDSVEVEGTLTFLDPDGSEVTKPVDTRTRGNFRRDKKNCGFPPLRLDFPKSQMDGTVFEDQDKLKLVSPCQQGRGNYQNYVFDEYLAYRIFNILTPYSYRVRLVQATFEDVNGEYDTHTEYGFLIESDDAMAERNRATMQDATQFHPARSYGEYAVTAAMFNYMIANTDWSPSFFHNSELIRTEDGRYMTIAYDFDFAGLVNARYATVDPQLSDRIRRVTQRLFRGFCRPELTYEQATPLFLEKRGEIEAMINDFAARGFEDFDQGNAEDMIDFLDDFYKDIRDADHFKDKILDDCRSMETGRRP